MFIEPVLLIKDKLGGMITEIDAHTDVFIRKPLSPKIKNTE
jgi:hypothetical protein